MTTLPIWVLLLFCIALVGFITLVYTRGNWRMALGFIGLALIAVLVVSGIEAWSDYIKSHFVGQFDQLGIPFREAGPGWTLVTSSWPLWLVPAGIFSLIALALGWWLHLRSSSLKGSHVADPLAQHNAASSPLGLIIPPAFEPQRKNLAYQLEFEAIKQELHSTKEKLAAVIEVAEEQIDKSQDLEIQIAQMAADQEEALADLQDQLAALELDVSTKKAQIGELTTLALQQTDEVIRLQKLLENS